MDHPAKDLIVTRANLKPAATPSRPRKVKPAARKDAQERSDGEAARDVAGGEPTLGERVRQIRLANKWTLSEVAKRSGTAISTLSKVENRRISLTYDNIVKLARGLGVDVAELFVASARHTANSRRSIARRGQGKLQSTPNYDYYYLSNDITKKRMLPIWTVIKCRRIEDFGPFLQHSGEEFIYVLTGAVEVHTECYEPVRLEAGEGVYLDSTMPHAYISVSKKNAVVLGICTSPERPGNGS